MNFGAVLAWFGARVAGVSGIWRVIVGLFTGNLAFLASLQLSNAALAAVSLTVVIAAWTAFYLAIKVAVLALTFAVPSPWFLMGFYLLWPDNADICVATCFTARTARLVYDMTLARVGIVRRTFMGG